MTKRVAFKQADLDRAIAVLEKRGLQVAAVRLVPGGAVEIVTGEPKEDDSDDWRAGSPLYVKAA